MDEIKLTKDADALICVLYKEYTERRKSGMSKSQARSFGGANCIHTDLMAKWSVDDIADTCGELDRAGLLSCFYVDNTVGESALTDAGIYYMENRFSNNISSLLSHIERLRSILPW